MIDGEQTMDILLICTTLFPDSAISAVRSSLLADRLTEAGENVTVLRSGEFEFKPFDDQTAALEGCEIISALGKNCDAERYKRGEEILTMNGNVRPPRFTFVPQKVKGAYRYLRDTAGIITAGRPPVSVRREARVLHYMKKKISELAGRHFDVVFATYGWLENIYAGLYAAELFDAKLIMDFRDFPIIRGRESNGFYWNRYAKKASAAVLKRADCITAVSDGLCSDLRKISEPKRIVTLRNGFDERAPLPDISPDKEKLTFCYTGRLNLNEYDALELFARTLSKLISSGRIDRRRIEYVYAGAHYAETLAFFEKYGIEDIVTNRGYVSRDEALSIQLSSDIHTVFSWNTKYDHGIMTGKFYEGVKAQKPVLAVVAGNVPGSELMQLQREYGYGCCCELSGGRSSVREMESFILSLYNEKLRTGSLSFRISEELYNAFNYTTLAEQLRSLMYELTGESRVSAGTNEQT